MCFKKITRKSVKGVTEMFQYSSVLQLCSCLDLIAATRAEGGLVYIRVVQLTMFWSQNKNIKYVCSFIETLLSNLVLILFILMDA